jgi:hypothetical protein
MTKYLKTPFPVMENNFQTSSKGFILFAQTLEGREDFWLVELVSSIE